MLAAHLYIGAGMGMAILGLYKKKRHEKPLQRSDLKYTSAMVALDIAAPIVALVIGETFASIAWTAATLLLGFVTYGLSIYYYTYAQRIIGAARTSTYYAIAPFIGVFLSMLILGESPNWPFFIALAIMLIGTYLASAKAEE